MRRSTAGVEFSLSQPAAHCEELASLNFGLDPSATSVMPRLRAMSMIPRVIAELGSLSQPRYDRVVDLDRVDWNIKQMGQ
ncbi:hypothetical protein ABFT80_14695 [Mesorhizobium sp. SB112]|uniref:hypothetical protein n=1 Tax=Mesorhizobium sp. SB112 TaxID=3151853 RepID=UPI003267410D